MNINHDHLREVAEACLKPYKVNANVDPSGLLALLDELAALRKENEGLRVDAERYSAVKKCPSLVMSFGKLDADGLDDRCDFHNKAKRGNFDHHDAARASR